MIFSNSLEGRKVAISDEENEDLRQKVGGLHPQVLYRVLYEQILIKAGPL